MNKIEYLEENLGLLLEEQGVSASSEDIKSIAVNLDYALDRYEELASYSRPSQSSMIEMHRREARKPLEAALKAAATYTAERERECERLRREINRLENNIRKLDGRY